MDCATSELAEYPFIDGFPVLPSTIDVQPNSSTDIMITVSPSFAYVEAVFDPDEIVVTVTGEGQDRMVNIQSSDLSGSFALELKATIYNPIRTMHYEGMVHVLGD